MKKRATWLSVGSGIAGVLILSVVTVTLIAARPAPPTSVTLERTRAPEGIATALFSPHTVKDAAKAQHLYDAVRALPTNTSSDFISCPLGSDAQYQLTFRSATGVELTAIIEDMGCRAVRIGNQGYVADAAFWQLLFNTFEISESQLFPISSRQ